jgi:16S rRNA processing protein RimM
MTKHNQRPRQPHDNATSPQQRAQPDEWLAIGEIVAPFGVRGEVKLLPQTDFPERIAEHSTLYLGPDHRPYSLLEARQHGNVFLLRLDGVPDMTAAERLRGITVFIPQEEAAPLDADQFYLHDLIGLRAVHVDGTDLGVVADVIDGAAQDVLQVRRPGHPAVLVPFVKEIVPTVDLIARTITIDPPIGLFSGEAIIVDENDKYEDDDEDEEDL